MLRSLLFTLLWLSILVVPPTAYADSPPTLDIYQQQVREAYAAAQRRDRIGLDDVAARLVGISEVMLADHSTVPVDNHWLKQELAQEPPDFPAITAQLGAILEVLSQPRTAPDPAALTKLPGIFEVPPFKDRAVPKGIANGWSRFWQAVGRIISRFFAWLGRLFNASPTISPSRPAPVPAPGTGFRGLSTTGTILLLIGVVLVVLLVVYAVRSVRGSLVRDAKAREAAVEIEELTASEALDRADQQARSGDYRTAVRYLFLSSLLWLHEQRLLRYDRSLTNREYLEQLDGKPLYSQMTPIVETFDRVWYGSRALSDEEWRAYEAQIAQLRQSQRPTS